MDITIRSVGEICHASGRPLEPGSRVRSFLIRNSEGLVERIDLLEDEKENISIEGEILCSWGHQIKPKGVTEADEKRAALQSAEDVFLSLYEDAADDPDGMLEATRDRLKFFLALQLERKRVLKSLGGRRYRHMPSKREYPVPDLELSPELIADFHQEFSLMGGTGY